ncbi:MAG: formylglycine-generating enzyme family protein [bacterium]|nr:formylglycine-generating enzyme family protein [bacterium]
MCKPICYLPLKDSHIVPFYGFDLEQVKKSSKDAVLNPSHKIKHTTLLNEITKKLGFPVFNFYKKEGFKSILDFLKDNELSHYKNLVTKNNFPMLTHCLSSREKLSERLFLSPPPLPEKVFTSYGIEFEDIIDELIDAYDNPDWYKRYAEIMNYDYEFLQKHHKVRALFYMYQINLESCANFLGDSLILPENGDGYIPQSYFTADSPMSRTDQQNQLEYEQELYKVFKRYIETLKTGWLTILQFNENIIFFKADDNTFDFVIKNERQNSYDRTYPDYCKYEDCTKTQLRERHFEEFLYFQDEYWIDKYSHEAELNYYNNGGLGHPHYPGLFPILRDYLAQKGLYSDEKSRAFSKEKIYRSFIPFYEVKRENRNSLFITNFITIEQYMEFFNDSDYRQRRKSAPGESFENMNTDNKNLPVCASWYDANAFAAWLSKQIDLDVRLLKVSEADVFYPRLEDIFESCDINENQIDFITPALEYFQNGTPIDIKKHLPEDKDASVVCKFKDNLTWYKNSSGLLFLINSMFMEWFYSSMDDSYSPPVKYLPTNQFIPDLVKTLKEAEENDIPISLYGDMPALYSNNKFSREYMGKHQHCKCGFRLCIDY